MSSSLRDRRALCERADRGVRPVRSALADDRLRIVLPYALDVFQTDAHCAAFDLAAGAARVHVRRQRLDAVALRVADERRRRIEAHRLCVQQRREKLRAVVVPQPGGLVREQPERSGVRLREAEARERDELVVDHVCELLVDAVGERAVDEPCPVRLERCEAPLAAHRTPQPFRLADGEAREMDRDVEHLILEDDDAERLAQRLAQQLVVGGRLEVGSSRSFCRRSMYGCTALPWIGPGRTSATWIVMSSRFSGRVRRIVCICARLSIWKQPTVSAR